MIQYQLSGNCFVKLTLFNLAGQTIETLVDGFKTSGEHHVQWKTRGLPSGIYFYKLCAGDYSITKKLVLQK